MRVNVTFYGPFKEHVDESAVEVDVPEGSTVADVIEELTERNEQLEDDLLEDGDIRESTRITVNETHLKNRDGLETQLEANDDLRVFPPVTGG